MTTTTATKKSSATTVKGIAATAAGVAVLLGGIGTFALWNADIGVLNDTVTSGKLKITETSALTWHDETPSLDNEIPNIEDFRMVPGDTIVGVTEITVVAQGENLRVEPELTPEGLGSDGPIKVTAELEDAAGNPIDTLEGNNAGTEQVLKARVKLHFDVEETGHQEQTLDLSDVTVSLQQVAPSSS